MTSPTRAASGEDLSGDEGIGKTPTMDSRTNQLVSLAVVAVAVMTAGGCNLSRACISSGAGAYPVEAMSPAWHPQPRSCSRPIDLSLLRRQPEQQHIVRTGDILGVYVEGVISGEGIFSGGSELPPVMMVPGAVEGVGTPAVGQPIQVHTGGVVHLPLIGTLQVDGMTLQEVADTIRQEYENRGFLKEEARSYTVVWLIQARVNRILVLREDALVQSFIDRESQILAKRGSAAVVELPLQNSDLLNALIATGGLPGEDARNEVWILRGGSDWNVAKARFNNGDAVEEIVGGEIAPPVTVIPLRYPCNHPLPFTKEDVLLQDGDVVFIEKRHEDYFYTGGLLSAGRIPLPRDQDVDIMEAIAMANIGVAGPAGVNAASSQFRGGPGNVIAPTRAIVIRKLPGGRQVRIEVDLREAVHDPSERILIAPEDFVMLHFRHHELIGNMALNMINFNYALR